MRIVGGHFKGKKLETPPNQKIRPTSDRLRETLFSILEFPRWCEPRNSLVKNAVILDGFCGTGALGLEAFSRGADFVTFMDNDDESLSLARRNMQKMGEAVKGKFKFMRTDLGENAPPTKKNADLIFLDPPYKKGLEIKALETLLKSGWIERGTHIILEMDRGDVAFVSGALPKGFVEKDSRNIGKTSLLIIVFELEILNKIRIL